jgi:pimeloyl-ACP methyl ester carboxylesterase
VYGHSLGGFVAMLYAARHPGHAGALVLQSTFARFDLGRIVEEFRRVGGDEVAAIVERAYGGDSRSVTDEEWAPCWRLVGSWVPGEQEQARTVANEELNAPGLALMRGFNVLDQLAQILPDARVRRRARPHHPGRSRPRDRRCAAQRGRTPRGGRGRGPLHLERCAGSLLADPYRVPDDRDGDEANGRQLKFSRGSAGKRGQARLSVATGE